MTRSRKRIKELPPQLPEQATLEPWHLYYATLGAFIDAGYEENVIDFDPNKLALFEKNENYYILYHAPSPLTNEEKVKLNSTVEWLKTKGNIHECYIVDEAKNDLNLDINPNSNPTIFSIKKNNGFDVIAEMEATIKHDFVKEEEPRKVDVDKLNSLYQQGIKHLNYLKAEYTKNLPNKENQNLSNIDQADLIKNQPSENKIKPQEIEKKPGFFQRHPVLKNILIGAGIGCAVLLTAFSLGAATPLALGAAAIVGALGTRFGFGGKDKQGGDSNKVQVQEQGEKLNKEGAHEPDNEPKKAELTTAFVRTALGKNNEKYNKPEEIEEEEEKLTSGKAEPYEPVPDDFTDESYNEIVDKGKKALDISPGKRIRKDNTAENSEKEAKKSVKFPEEKEELEKVKVSLYKKR